MKQSHAYFYGLKKDATLWWESCLLNYLKPSLLVHVGYKNSAMSRQEQSNSVNVFG